jgi:hypothetical protein
MPGTGVAYGLKSRADFFSVDKNLEAYGAHMRDLLAQYGGNVDLALIAYNAGPGVANRILANFEKGGKGARLPAETRGYLADITKYSRSGGGTELEHQQFLAGITPKIVESPTTQAALNKLRDRQLGQPLEGGTEDLAELPLKLQRQWQIYYADIETREQQLRDRREDFAVEYETSQRHLAADLEDIELNLMHLRRQAADDQFSEQRRLLSARREELDLERQLIQVQDDLANGPLNQSLRIQLSLFEDIHDIRRRDEDAIKDKNRAELELADATIYHAVQADAAVLRFLASQRTVTEVIADAKVGVIQATFDLIDRGLDKFTSKLGIIGSLVKELLSGFIRIALSKFFQSINGGAGAAPGGGGGGIGGFLGNLAGRFLRPAAMATALAVGGGGPGGPASAPFILPGGGASPFTQEGGGGNVVNAQAAQFAALSRIGTTGSLPVPQSLSSQLANQQGIASAIHESGHATGTAATGALGSSSFTTSLAAMLPMLGLSVGARLGGTSRFGTVVGGAGGLIAGGIGAAFLAPGLFAAGGLFGSMGPLIAGLLTNPFTAIAAGALIVGALLLGRNSARKRDEATRNQAMLDSLGQLDEIIRAVKTDKMDLTSGVAAAMQIRQQYVTSMNALKDSKTRRIALQDVYRLDLKIDEIRKAGEGQQRRRDIEKRLVPEFAHGGTVPYGNTMFSMMTGLTPIKVRPGEVMIPPGGFGVTVPGVDHGYDSVYTMAPPRTRVLTKSQASSARGFDRGGVVGGFGGDDRPIEVHVHLSPQFVVDKETAGKVIAVGGTTTDGRKAMIKVYESRHLNGN